MVAANPHNTGIRFFLASSIPPIAATGITPHGIMVPPPTQTVTIWPSAAGVSVCTLPTAKKVCAMNPVSGSLENLSHQVQ